MLQEPKEGQLIEANKKRDYGRHLSHIENDKYFAWRTLKIGGYIVSAGTVLRIDWKEPHELPNHVR